MFAKFAPSEHSAPCAKPLLQQGERCKRSYYVRNVRMFAEWTPAKNTTNAGRSN